MRRGSQRRVVCGLNTHGCKPVLRNALGLGLGARFRRSRHALVETFPGRPGIPKQVVREGSTLRLRLERMGYLNIASICSRKHKWGLNTMPHPNFFGFLKGSREGACDGLPAPPSFAA